MKDIDGMDITTARNENIVFMPVPKGVSPNDLIRREKNFRLKPDVKGIV